MFGTRSEPPPDAGSPRRLYAALAAATINSAKAISCERRAGSIEPGKQADFLALTTPDYRNLSYRYGSNQVALVVKKGELYPN